MHFRFRIYTTNQIKSSLWIPLTRNEKKTLSFIIVLRPLWLTWSIGVSPLFCGGIPLLWQKIPAKRRGHHSLCGTFAWILCSLAAAWLRWRCHCVWFSKICNGAILYNYYFHRGGDESCYCSHHLMDNHQGIFALLIGTKKKRGGIVVVVVVVFIHFSPVATEF